MSSHRPSAMTPRTISSGFVRGGPLRDSGAIGESPLRRWWGVGAGALLLPLLLTWWLASPAPTLATLALDGPRGPECLRLVLATDVSGSMRTVTAARDRALGQFLAWAPENLRDDDEIAVVAFAASAGGVRGPLPVSSQDLDRLTALGPPTPGDRTNLVPVLEAVADLGQTQCRTALALISDGQYADLPPDEAAGLDTLRRAGVAETALLVPSRTVSVPTEWESAFPTASPRVFDGLDADATGRALGSLVADLTGQRLVPL